MRAVWCAAVPIALIAMGCGGAPRTPASTAADPCSGDELDLDALRARCRVDRMPSPDQLVVSADPATVRAGETTRVRVVVRNAGDRPLELVIPSASFRASVWSDERRVDREVEAVVSVECRAMALFESSYLSELEERAGPARGRLAPGGTLVAHVDVTARVTRVSEDTDLRGTADCGLFVESDAGPLAPGRYEVEIALPWVLPAAGGERSESVTRRLRTALTVTP